MNTLLKVCIVALLITGIGSAYFGFQNYNSRKEFKQRSDQLEQGVKNIAQTLGFQESLAGLNNLGTLDAAVNQINAQAEGVLSEKERIQQDLADTEEELAGKEEEIVSLETQLNDSEAEINDLNRSLRQKSAEVAEARANADSYQNELASLKDTVSDLENQVADKEDELYTLQGDITALEAEQDKLQKELQVCKGTVEGVVPEGLTAEVLQGNPQWNFVVLDKGSEQGIIANLPAYVHRADKLIGKVKITTVEENLSVAEVDLDWKKDEIQPGDKIFFE